MYIVKAYNILESLTRENLVAKTGSKHQTPPPDGETTEVQANANMEEPAVGAEQTTDATATAATASADDGFISPYFPLSPQPPAQNGDVEDASSDVNSLDSVDTLPAVRSSSAQVPSDAAGREKLLELINASQNSFAKTVGDHLKASAKPCKHKDEFSRVIKTRMSKKKRTPHQLPTIGEPRCAKSIM